MLQFKILVMKNSQISEETIFSHQYLLFRHELTTQYCVQAKCVYRAIDKHFVYYCLQTISSGATM